MRESFELGVAFKGGRDYLQGGDLFLAVHAALRPRMALDKLALSFERKTAKRPVLLVETDAQADFQRPAQAFGRLLANPGQQRGWLIESDEPVTDRHPFDEKALLAFGRFEGLYAEVTGEPGGEAVELFIAFIKQLHIANYAIDATDHWAVTHIDMNMPPPTGNLAGCRLSIDARLGTKLTKSSIHRNGALISTMFFSALPR